MKILVWLSWPEDCFRANESDVEYLRGLVGGRGEVAWAHDENAFLGALGDATHVVTWHFRREWYGLAPKMRVLATPAAGRELVAWQDAPRGVKVHFGAFHGAIIAESVAAFCLGWARGFFREAPASGIWPRTWLGDKCRTVAGTKAVIAGYGKIGKAIGAKLAGLGVDVKGFSRANIERLEPAMRDADWFILALPGDTGTDDFLDARRIALLPPRCAVVNIGRGNAIDETALAEALRTGRLAAAYLDVFKHEYFGTLPDAAEASASIAAARLPNLVAMPHSSAFSPDYVKMSFKELDDEGLFDC